MQDYLEQYGARKVEANALVTKSKEERELCRAAILKYLKDDTLPEQWESSLTPGRDALRTAMRAA